MGVVNMETVEFRLVDDAGVPPITITMDENDKPKVILNAHHKIWLAIHRKTIGGSAEALFGKINELLTAYLMEQRAFEKLEESELE